MVMQPMWKELPRWERPGPEDTTPPIYWSGPVGFDPPEVGATVDITLNGWEGAWGVVEGYNYDHGWLMVHVRVPRSKRPEWHVEELPDRDVCLFAGCELKRSP